MATDYYCRVLGVLEGTSIRYFAPNMLESYCTEIGRSPNSLKPNDGGALITHLMSRIVDFISEDEWLALDEKFKTLMSDGQGNAMKGRAKGIILEVLMMSIKRKWGTDAVEKIREKEGVPAEFKSDVWYPLDILISMIEDLNNINAVNPNYRQIGMQIMTKSGAESSLYIFRKTSLSLTESFVNLTSFFALDGFEVKKAIEGDDSGVTIRYTGVDRESFKLLLAGICSGIMELRAEPATVEISRMRRGGGAEMVIMRERTDLRVATLA